MQCCWRKSRSRVPPVPATSTTHSGWLESGFKLVMSSCPILTILKDRCFKVACVDRWHWQTDSRPDKIVCEGAREATAVNGIIGVALRPLALGSRFHVVILITILACCDDACTVWMWTTSWTFWTRFSLTMEHFSGSAEGQHWRYWSGLKLKLLQFDGWVKAEMQLTNRPGGPVSEQSPYNGLLRSATIGIPSIQWENHDLEESLGVLMRSNACALDSG